ncbi:MAG: four helix bundle protein [Bacteroidaceae bacterium]|nr:four helix bundle protein [Bacteroidaceae bacterium]
MLEDNTIRAKSKSFAIRIVKMAQYLQEEKHEYVLSKQILRSGTSIGANIRESKNAESTPDFIHKLEIALKESDETEYWLEILNETNYITQTMFESMMADNNEITAMLTSIVKTTKENNKKSKTLLTQS